MQRATARSAVDLPRPAMRWFVLRALGLWFTSIVITSAVVLGVRADPESPTLKAVGLSLCEGAPCFRGLKVGSSWDEVLKRFPDSLSYKGTREIPINVGDVWRARILPSDAGKTVKDIIISKGKNFSPTIITTGEIVALFGVPCLVITWEYADAPEDMFLIYPELKVYVDVQIGDSLSENYQLQPTSSVYEIWVSSSGQTDLTCDYSRDEYSGRWQGFISVDQYLSRFRSNSLK